MADKALLNSKEAAHYLSVSVSTLRGLGILPVRLSKTCARYRVTDLETMKSRFSPVSFEPDDKLIGPISLTCLDCTSFAVNFSGGQPRCSTAQRVVSWDCPSCPKIKPHPLTKIKYVHDQKVRFFREKFTEISSRLNEQNEDLTIRINVHESHHKNARKNVVYFVDCGEYTKIGHTTNPVKQRMRSLAANNPYTLSLWGLLFGSIKLERWFHREFKQWNHRYEWFKLTSHARTKAHKIIIQNEGAIYTPDDEWLTEF